MPDISMCNNSKCRKFKECYRAQAKPNEFWQSYDAFKEDTDKELCLGFMKIWGNDRELVLVEK